MDEGEIKTSKFSSGLNIIMRLDELWKDTHKFSRSGQYKLWNSTLDRIWLELARDLYGDKEDEFMKKNKEYENFDESLRKIGNFCDSAPEGFQKIEKVELENRDKHYKVLISKQLFLARLENQLGKGTTFEEGDDDDFD